MSQLQNAGAGRLKYEMVRRGLSYVSIAEEIGVSDRSVYRWLDGHVKPHKTHKTALINAIESHPPIPPEAGRELQMPRIEWAVSKAPKSPTTRMRNYAPNKVKQSGMTDQEIAVGVGVSSDAVRRWRLGLNIPTRKNRGRLYNLLSQPAKKPPTTYAVKSPIPLSELEKRVAVLEGKINKRSWWARLWGR